MKLRLKLFIVPVALLTLFTLLSLPVDCRNVLAQTPSGAVKVTFVEIGSVNCIPCKAMQPIMKAVEEEYQGQVKIVFHDVWTEKGKTDALKYNIRMIPTQVFLDKDGREYFRHEGYYPKADVVRVIKMRGVK
ncbi:MAG: thioredoxin family protein [Deltaproteobacteria bacterium]